MSAAEATVSPRSRLSPSPSAPPQPSATQLAAAGSRAQCARRTRSSALLRALEARRPHHLLDPLLLPEARRRHAALHQRRHSTSRPRTLRPPPSTRPPAPAAAAGLASPRAPPIAPSCSRLPRRADPLVCRAKARAICPARSRYARAACCCSARGATSVNIRLGSARRGGGGAMGGRRCGWAGLLLASLCFSLSARPTERSSRHAGVSWTRVRPPPTPLLLLLGERNPDAPPPPAAPDAPHLSTPRRRRTPRATSRSRRRAARETSRRRARAAGRRAGRAWGAGRARKGGTRCVGLFAWVVCVRACGADVLRRAG